MSFCPRNYFLLPADRCAEATALFKLAREDAMRAKREMWREKYGANGAVTGSGTKGNGLVFDSFAAAKAQYDLGGFCKLERLPKKLQGDDQGDLWLGKPNRATKRGKEVASDMDYVEELCDIWQWSLERALSIEGTVFYNHAFHKTVAKLLKDGRVIASVPEDKNRPRSEGYSRNFEATVMPEWAQRISREEYESLENEVDRYEESVEVAQ